MRILFATKDLSGQIAVRVAALARAGGEEVFVAAEGLSVKLWKRAGFPLAFEGKENFQEHHFDFDANALLTIVRPDVVVVCSGMPINIERKLIWAAMMRGTPAVLLSDIWKCGTRLGQDGQFPKLAAALVVDAYDHSAIAPLYPQAQFTIVGNAGVGEEVPYEGGIQHKITGAREKGGLIVSFVGGKSSDDLALCVESMLRTRGILIPRLHPKSVGSRLASGQTLRDRCVELLRPLGDRVLWLDEYPEPRHSIQIVRSSDVVCSGFSTLLSTAVVAGVVGVVLWTPEVRSSLYAATTLEVSPHVALGVARLLTEPRDLGGIHLNPELARRRLSPFDPATAYRAIKDVLSS